MSKCDVNAECLSGKMTYHCRCMNGYVGDGITCNLVPQVIGHGKLNDADGMLFCAIFLLKPVFTSSFRFVRWECLIRTVNNFVGFLPF